MRRLLTAVALIAILGACTAKDEKAGWSPHPEADMATTTTRPDGSGPEGPQAYVDSGTYVTGLHMAKITMFDRATRTVTYDVVQFLTGEAAKAAYEDDLGETPDTDYYIRNQNTQVRSAVIGPTAVFRVNNLGGYPPADPDKGHEVDFDTFAAYFDAEQAFDAYFWISLEDRAVVAIEEQYIP